MSVDSLSWRSPSWHILFTWISTTGSSSARFGGSSSPFITLRKKKTLCVPGLPLGLQPPLKCLPVPWKLDRCAHIWSRLLHRDGVAFGQDAEDHHWCLCHKDDQRTKVDAASFPHFHRGHTLHGCQCFGQTVEKGPDWRFRIEGFRMVTTPICVDTIYFHTNYLCWAFVQKTTVQVRKSPTNSKIQVDWPKLQDHLSTCVEFNVAVSVRSLTDLGF